MNGNEVGRSAHGLETSGLASLVTAFLVVASMAIPSAVLAADPGSTQWDGGAGDGLWSSALNWSGDVLPGPTTSVVIENQPAIVHMDVDVTLSGTGSLKVSGLGVNAPTLVVDPGTTLTLANPGMNNVVEYDASLRNEGVVQQDADFRAQLRGNVFNASGATWTVGAPGVFTRVFDASGLATDSTLINLGTFTLYGSLRIASIVVNHGTLNMQWGGISVRGLANAGTAFANAGTLHNSTTGTLTTAAGTAMTVGDPTFVSADTLVNDGTLSAAGSITLHRSVTNTGIFANTGTTDVRCGADVRGPGTFTSTTIIEGCKLWDNDSGDGKWSTPANWSLNSVPTTHAVRIDGLAAATDVHVDQNVTISAGRTLEHTGDDFIGDRLNTLTIDPGVTLTLNGTFAVRHADVLNQGTIAVGGTGRLEVFGHPNYDVANFDNQGTITNAGTIAVQGSATSTLADHAQYGILSNAGTISNTGTVSVPNGTLADLCGGLMTGTAPTIGPEGLFTETLCVPELEAPTDGAGVADATTSFVWSNPSERRAVTYEWELRDALTNELVALASPSGRQYTPASDVPDGSYFWTVRAVKGTARSDWATAFALTTGSTSTGGTPTIDQLNAPATAEEGSFVSVKVAFANADTPTVRIDWGDGSTPTIVDPAISSAAAIHSYADDGTFTITVFVSNADGATAQASTSIEITNVVPAATAAYASTSAITETPVVVTGVATDPSTVDDAEGLQWRWSVNGGPFGDYGAAGNDTFEIAFSWCGIHTVAGQARDKDGGVSGIVTTTINALDARFTAPLVAGELNTVRGGRVLPVTISVGCSGVLLAGLEPRIQLLLGDATPGLELPGDEIPTVSASQADGGGTMRPVDNGYRYNLMVPDSGKRQLTYTIRVRPFGDTRPTTAIYIVIRTRG